MKVQQFRVSDSCDVIVSILNYFQAHTLLTLSDKK